MGVFFFGKKTWKKQAANAPQFGNISQGLNGVIVCHVELLVSSPVEFFRARDSPIRVPPIGSIHINLLLA